MSRFLTVLMMAIAIFSIDARSSTPQPDKPEEPFVYLAGPVVIFDKASAPLAAYTSKYKPALHSMHEKKRPEILTLIGDLVTEYSDLRNVMAGLSIAHLKKIKAIPDAQQFPRKSYFYFEGAADAKGRLLTFPSKEAFLQFCNTGLLKGKPLSDDELRLTCSNLISKCFCKRLEIEIAGTLVDSGIPHFEFLMGTLAQVEDQLTLMVGLSASCSALWTQQYFDPTFNLSKTTFATQLKDLKPMPTFYSIEAGDQSITTYFEKNLDKQDLLNLASICGVLSNFRTTFAYIKDGWVKEDVKLLAAPTVSQSKKKKTVVVEGSVKTGKAEKQVLLPLMEQEKKTLQKENQKLTNRIKDLESQLTAARKQKQELKDRQAPDQSAAIAESKKTIKELRDEIGTLKDDQKNLKQQLHDKQQEVAPLKKKVTEETRKKEKTHEARVAAENENKSLKESMAAKEKEFQAKLAEAQQEIERLQAQLKERDATNEQLKTAVAGKDKALADKDSVIAEQTHQLKSFVFIPMQIADGEN